MLIVHFLSFVHCWTYVGFVAKSPWIYVLLLISAFCHGAQMFYLYIWRYGSGRNAAGQKYTPSACLLFGFLLGANFAAEGMAILNNFVDESLDAFIPSWQYADFQYSVGAIAFAVAKIDALVVYMELASELRHCSETVRKIPRNLRADNVSQKCFESSALIARLSQRLQRILSIIYLEYCIRFIFRLPSVVPYLMCASSLSATVVLRNMVQLLQLLYVTHQGNKILVANKELRRRVRLMKEFHDTKAMNLRFFCRQQSGVQFLFGASLGWPTFYAYVGSTWGFTFMFLQLVLAIREIKCWELNKSNPAALRVSQSHSGTWSALDERSDNDWESSGTSSSSWAAVGMELNQNSRGKIKFISGIQCLRISK